MDSIIHLALGSYGYTLFPASNGDAGLKGKIAEVLKKPDEALKKLTLTSVPTSGNGQAYIIPSGVSKVSHILNPTIPDMPNILQSAIQLDARADDRVDILLDCGVTAILAHTQWGKTTYVVYDLIPAMLRSGVAQVRFLSFLEPFEDLVFDQSVKTIWCTSHEALFAQIASFIMSDDKVCVVDSLRPFIYDQSVGGTAAGGMDAYLPVQLTALSNVMSLLGKHLIVTINPMMPLISNEDRARFYDLRQRIASSVPTMMSGEHERKLDITLRGPSSRNSRSAKYTVPTINFAKPASGTNVSTFESTANITSASTVQNLVAGIVSNL